MAAAQCQAARSSCQPILVLPPIGVDNLLFFVRWKFSGAAHSLAIAGILGGRKHVPVVALGALNLITQAFQVAACKLEHGETNAVRLSMPTLRPILIEHGQRL